MTVIAVHPRFDATWPFAADHFATLLSPRGKVEVVRVANDSADPVAAAIPRAGEVTRLICLGLPITTACVAAMTALRELVADAKPSDEVAGALRARGVEIFTQESQGFWGESVSEFALGLTICGLRRIPQTHASITHSHAEWDYSPPGNVGTPRARGIQYGDDSRFTNGTVAGKRVRIVGAGNISARYASFCAMLGAEVAAWDPFASEPCFHRAGARRVRHLDALVTDAEIFAPMLPLTDKTRGTITAELINALPRGCLVVLVTRAEICDVPTLRHRVLNDELALAADVFDVEPVPLNDALLGRHNMVHTPHNAGRTIRANEQWAEALVSRLR